MTRVGIVGIGDMGSGLAKNLLGAGFEVAGFDLLAHRMDAFGAMGGLTCASVAEVAAGAQAAFVMVMTGDEAKSVILGKDGLAAHMPKGAVILLTATIKPSEAVEIGAALEGTGV
ncbi:MAG: NAD(P)-binding domain-containing protein, partial [Pseudomonadota bacterium]